MKTVGIICAMDSEFEKIKQALHEGELVKCGLQTFLVGEYARKRVAAATCGIGKVNAAACTQAMISQFQPNWIINSGVSGALSPKLDILDLVIAQEVMYHDLEERLLQSYFPHCSRFQADGKLVSLVESICEQQGVPHHRGLVVSGDQFVTDGAVKADIVARTNGDTVEMESAAIGHTCYLNQVPFAIIRCISDRADDSGAMDFDTFVVKAAQRCAALTLAAVEALEA